MICSNCNSVVNNKTNFCPVCGLVIKKSMVYHYIYCIAQFLGVIPSIVMLFASESISSGISNLILNIFPIIMSILLLNSKKAGLIMCYIFTVYYIAVGSIGIIASIIIACFSGNGEWGKLALIVSIVCLIMFTSILLVNALSLVYYNRRRYLFK